MADVVYVLTVTWNHCEDTLSCLASLYQSSYLNFHVLLVDNGSTDGTPARVRVGFPQVEIIELGQNRGFAVGANAGLQHALAAGANYILLINNDTELATDMLERLLEHAAIDVGILAPLVYYANPADVIWSAGGRLRPRLLEQIGDQRGLRDPRHWLPEVERDFVPACGIILSRQLIQAIGLFDERFFMYYEDSDYCLRARRAGFRILLVPEAKLWHKVSISSGGIDSPAERYGMARSSILFFRKHVRGLNWLIVGPYRLGSAIKMTGRLLVRGRVSATKAYWRGIRDGWIAA